MSASSPLPVGSVVGLWRYPVKSLQGEALTTLEITPDGVAGDRRQALIGDDDRALTAKREPRLLHAAAWGTGDAVRLRLPDGKELLAGGEESARRLSSWLGYRVRIAEPRGAGAFVDDRPVHLLSAAAAGAHDPRRFRPNVVVALAPGAPPEELWPGRSVQVGGVRLRVSERTIRCTMVDAPQPGIAGGDGLLRLLRQRHQSRLGVYATVELPGRVAVGDPVLLEG